MRLVEEKQLYLGMHLYGLVQGGGHVNGESLDKYRAE
jgi:hypothetical protein